LFLSVRDYYNLSPPPLPPSILFFNLPRTHCLPPLPFSLGLMRIDLFFPIRFSPEMYEVWCLILPPIHPPPLLFCHRERRWEFGCRVYSPFFSPAKLPAFFFCRFFTQSFFVACFCPLSVLLSYIVVPSIFLSFFVESFLFFPGIVMVCGCMFLLTKWKSFLPPPERLYSFFWGVWNVCLS